MKCWCQMGNIECRRSTESSNGMGDVVIYAVIAFSIIILFVGGICCVGSILSYYYYTKNSSTHQETYDQHYNHAGWQPMTVDGQVVDTIAEEKQAEAEQSQYYQGYPAGSQQEYVPPPYAMYNGPYPSGEQSK
jgi:hypothetical protein